jgi:hypothetical protein
MCVTPYSRCAQALAAQLALDAARAYNALAALVPALPYDGAPGAALGALQPRPAAEVPHAAAKPPKMRCLRLPGAWQRCQARDRVASRNTYPRAGALPPLVRCEWARGQPRLAPLPAGAPAEALPARAAAHAARRLSSQCAAAGAAGRPFNGASDDGPYAGELGVRITREDAVRLRASAGPCAASGGPAGPPGALVGGDAVRARAGAAPPRAGGRPEVARVRAAAGARGADARRGGADVAGGGGPARGGGATLAAVVDRRACVCKICFQARPCHDQVLPLPAANIAGFAAASCRG